MSSAVSVVGAVSSVEPALKKGPALLTELISVNSLVLPAPTSVEYSRLSLTHSPWLKRWTTAKLLDRVFCCCRGTKPTTWVVDGKAVGSSSSRASKSTLPTVKL